MCDGIGGIENVVLTKWKEGEMGQRDDRATSLYVKENMRWG